MPAGHVIHGKNNGKAWLSTPVSTAVAYEHDMCDIVAVMRVAGHVIHGKNNGKAWLSTPVSTAVAYEHDMCDIVAVMRVATTGPCTGSYSWQLYIPGPLEKLSCCTQEQTK